MENVRSTIIRDVPATPAGVRRVAGKIKIIPLSPDGFEHDRAWFWAMFDWTLGLLLAEYIEHKSWRVVRQFLAGQEELVGGNGSGTGSLLDYARQNFGSNRAAELFRLRTCGFNVSSPLLQHFCENVAGAAALDDVYNALGSFACNGQRLYPMSAPPDAWSNFYLACPNAQSVRNRYRQVARLYRNHGGGRTLSIACGSAQSLVHALAELKSKGQGSESRLILTDASRESLSLARQRADEAGVGDQVVARRVTLRTLADRFAHERFDVVEACGIFDYLTDEDVIRLLRFALSSLNPGGLVIASNMAKTRAARLLLKTYNWPIRYRTPERFGRLIETAGGKDIRVYVEPWGIHPVATAAS